jgi:N-acetylneuraminate synthase
LIEIGKRLIGSTEEPYIIAELSANHGGSLERAKQTIAAAKLAGAHAVKIQSYTPDTMTIDCSKEDFQIKQGLWKGYSLYQLYSLAQTPYEWHQDIFNHAKKIGITLFSTPFDESAVELLESLDTPAYKLASFEITDIPLIKTIAETKKPILMSTGMATLEEVSEAVEVAKSAGNDKIVLLHCISSYPASLESANLQNIPILREQFNLDVGLSDHTMGATAAAVSIALGAVVIEKHFKLDENENGPDASFSIDQVEMRELVNTSKKVWSALRNSTFSRSNEESENIVFRRSIYFVKDKKAGQTVEESDIKRIRPGHGLHPRHYQNVIGKTLLQDVERGDALTVDVIDL